MGKVVGCLALVCLIPLLLFGCTAHFIASLWHDVLYSPRPATITEPKDTAFAIAYDKVSREYDRKKAEERAAAAKERLLADLERRRSEAYPLADAP